MSEPQFANIGSEWDTKTPMPKAINGYQKAISTQENTTIDMKVEMDPLIPVNFKQSFIDAYNAANDWDDLKYVAGVNKNGPIKVKYFTQEGKKIYLGGYKHKRKSNKRKNI